MRAKIVFYSISLDAAAVLPCNIDKVLMVYKSNTRDVLHYPENVAPTGPILRIRVARDSPSFRGGGCDSFISLISLQVMRVGAQAQPGGTITRIPE